MKPVEINRARIAIAAVSMAIGVFALAYADAHNSSAGAAVAATEESATGPTGLALEVQDEIQRAGLVEGMEAALAADFAGVWYDSSTAQLHVGVVSRADRRTVEAAAAATGLADNVTAAPVRSTWAELVAEQDRLSDRLAELSVGAGASTWLDPVHNSVGVELYSWVPSWKRVELERQGESAPVAVSISVVPPRPLQAERKNGCNKFAASAAYCDTLVAGVTLEAENTTKCTLGPGLILQDLSKPKTATETYLLTAGHCIEKGGGNGAKWYAYTTKPTKTEIGKALEFQNAEIDAGVIKVENANWLSPGFIPLSPAIAPWAEETPIPFPVLGETPSVVGNKTCISGQKSGTSCGEIKKIGLEYTWTGGEVSKELTEVKGVTAAPGDSGAPFYSESSWGYLEGTDVGTIKTGNEVYQPLADSLSKLKTKFSLLSDVNELRHPKKFLSELTENTTVTSTADGTGKTAHHVIDAAGASLTCTSLSLSGTQAIKEASELKLGATYAGCTYVGLATTVSMGGCEFVLHSSGIFEIASKAGKNCATEPIKWEVAGCKIEVPSQGGRELLTYKNIKPGAVTEVTMEMNVTGITYKATGGSCVKTGEFSDGSYTTGNTILTGAKPGGGAMVNYSWE